MPLNVNSLFAIFYSKFNNPIGNVNITSSNLGISNEKRLGTLTFHNRDSGHRNVRNLLIKTMAFAVNYIIIYIMLLINSNLFKIFVPLFVDHVFILGNIF